MTTGTSGGSATWRRPKVTAPAIRQPTAMITSGGDKPMVAFMNGNSSRPSAAPLWSTMARGDRSPQDCVPTAGVAAADEREQQVRFTCPKGQKPVLRDPRVARGPLPRNSEVPRRHAGVQTRERAPGPVTRVHHEGSVPTVLPGLAVPQRPQGEGVRAHVDLGQQHHVGLRCGRQQAVTDSTPCSELLLPLRDRQVEASITRPCEVNR